MNLSKTKIFNKVYNSISDHIKTPLAATQLHYAKAFDYEFSILLRERESSSLVEMQNDAVKFELNMAATKRSKMGKKKLKEEEKPSSSSYAKFDSMMKTMEKLMDKLVLRATPLPPAQQETYQKSPI